MERNGTASLLFLLSFMAITGCKDGYWNNQPSGPAATLPAAVSEVAQPVKIEYWRVDHDTNPVTSVVTTTAYLQYQGGDQNIYVRQRGTKPECFITTGQFLETLENLNSGVSTVQYRFDGGTVIHQKWSLGANNTTLFYPGNCSPFIAQLGKARTMAFEYSPADKLPDTITFNVEGFPNAFKVTPPTAPKHHVAAAKPCVIGELATLDCNEERDALP
jgi:hypothetical protein